MEFKIKSRRIKKEVTFSRPGSGYVFCDLGEPKRYGTLGQQICDGGRLIGSTISYRGEDPEEFAAVCRTWWKTYLRRN